MAYHSLFHENHIFKPPYQLHQQDMYIHHPPTPVEISWKCAYQKPQEHLHNFSQHVSNMRLDDILKKNPIEKEKSIADQSFISIPSQPIIQEVPKLEIPIDLGQS